MMDVFIGQGKLSCPIQIRNPPHRGNLSFDAFTAILNPSFWRVWLHSTYASILSGSFPWPRYSLQSIHQLTIRQSGFSIFAGKSANSPLYFRIISVDIAPGTPASECINASLSSQYFLTAFMVLSCSVKGKFHGPCTSQFIPFPKVL